MSMKGTVYDLYAFFLFVFVQKSFLTNFFYYFCWDKLDYSGSIVYLSCFYCFFQKSLFTENYFLIAVINLATWGPLYTCLVNIVLWKIGFVASLIRNSLCIIYFFLLFFQKSLFTENYFLIAVINLATRGPLYTCLV